MDLAKKCQGCKKMLTIEKFKTDEREAIYSKCHKCRLTLVKRANCCELCGIRATFNFEGEMYARFCCEHKEAGMVDVKRKKCDIKSCSIIATFNFEGELCARVCHLHSEAGMVDVRGKKCEKCTKQPSFNFEGETRGRFCGEHKEAGMVDVKHKTCESKGCRTRPNFNFEGETRGRFCGEHKEAGMVNVKDKTCESKGCRTLPNFNFEGETRGRFCGEHKEAGMVNVKDKTCESKGCRTLPSFNFEGETRGRFCGEHKEAGMVNVKDKTCEKCTKIPAFNFEGETRGRFCGEHKDIGMVDIKNNKCESNGCRTQARFNLPGSIAAFCGKHKKPDMISSPRKKCTTTDCQELAIYGIYTQLHCEEHKTKDEYNLVERTCSNCKRIDILNRDGICVSFCSPDKQDQAMKRHVKKKEEFIANLLEHEFPHLAFTRDKVVDSMCSKARPDFVYDFNTFVLIVEVDEDQHSSYTSCGHTLEERMTTERRRMFSIFQSFGGCPVIFLRYNPDSFRVDGKLSKIGERKRQDTLISWIKKLVKTGHEFEGCNAKYLFYDNYNDSCTAFEIIEEKDVV